MTIRVDDLGTEVDVPDDPRRVVSLVPSITEALWWYHAADRVVACTDYCVAPPDGFPHAIRVRGTKNPDLDAIVERSPDVVIANEEENRELDVRRLREAGVAVFVTAPRTVLDAARTLADIGRVVGAESAGEALGQSIRRAVERIERLEQPVSAFVPVWKDPWMATGHDTYAADLLALTGFEVVATAPRYPVVDLAEVEAADPDAVLLPDEPYVFTRDDRGEFDGWRARVRQVDGTALTWYGPRTPHAIGDFARLARSIRRRERRARVAGGSSAS